VAVIGRSGAVNIMRSLEVPGDLAEYAPADKGLVGERLARTALGRMGLYRRDGIWSRHQPVITPEQQVATGRGVLVSPDGPLRSLIWGGMEVGATVLATSHDGRRFSFLPAASRSQGRRTRCRIPPTAPAGEPWIRSQEVSLRFKRSAAGGQ
jgi:hypothetical protein